MKNGTYEGVFGELNKSLFTLKEASEYLEITEEELYSAWLDEEIDGDVMFSVKEIRRFKKECRENEG